MGVYGDAYGEVYGLVYDGTIASEVRMLITFTDATESTAAGLTVTTTGIE